MNNAAYHMMHYTLPTVIDGPGEYVTRGGDTVTITRVSGNRAEGKYSCGIAERWSCRGGRVLPFYESRNDVVRRVKAEE